MYAPAVPLLKFSLFVVNQKVLFSRKSKSYYANDQLINASLFLLSKFRESESTSGMRYRGIRSRAQ